MQYWLFKSEPGTYSWDDLKRDTSTHWDGVRNYAARNNMRAMKKGDLGFFYHSVKERSVVGVVRVIKEAYEDHTAKKGDWSMVDIEPVIDVGEIITLDDIKTNPELKDMVLVNNSRLSVQPVRPTEWKECLKMSDTTVS